MAGLTVSRILHAGYVFAQDGVRIAFDTLFENPFSRNCHAFPDLRFDVEQIREQHFDAVFISHFHDDHCSLDSLDLLPRTTPLYLYCLHPELFEMLRTLGFSKVTPLCFDQAVAVGPFVVTPRAGMDAEVDAMFQVQSGALNILNVVDTWIDDEALARLVQHGPWDMVLWPFQTMRELEVLAPTRFEPATGDVAPEALAQLAALAPRVVVPSSCQFRHEAWSWTNHAYFPISYARFGAQVEQHVAGCRVVRLDPGASLALDAHQVAAAPRLPWVVPVGPQGLDYDYQPQAPVPPVATIASRFAALTPAQWASLTHWCEQTLPQRYAEFGAMSAYFDQPRRWRLSLLDHDGTAQVFDYLLDDELASLQCDTGAPVQWSTELPAARLLAAIVDGESLTSLHVRINVQQFDAATEAALRESEVMDDPLIRCLLDGSVCSYQAGQLRRLTARTPAIEV